MTRWRITSLDGTELANLARLEDAGAEPFLADVVIDCTNGLVTLQRGQGPIAYAEQVAR